MAESTEKATAPVVRPEPVPPQLPPSEGVLALDSVASTLTNALNILKGREEEEQEQVLYEQQFEEMEDLGL